MTTKVENSNKAIIFIVRVNSPDACEAGHVNLGFDLRTKRVLFFPKYGKGAVGRN